MTPVTDIGKRTPVTPVTPVTPPEASRMTPDRVLHWHKIACAVCWALFVLSLVKVFTSPLE